MKRIAVVNYGIGNLKSISNALSHLEQDFSFVESQENLSEYSHIILPGVGSYKVGMNLLRRKKFDSAILAEVNKGKPLLGICLGMQMLANRSSEDGETKGLALINAEVDIFSKNEVGGLKIPHVGFDTIRPISKTGIFAGFKDQVDFYFTHSYRVLCSNKSEIASESTYGIKYVSAFCKDNIIGTQFHPEKSQKNGLRLLKNFTNYC
ncbi:MAG: imidazole glycerol phosphate synthase subunit HisH [Rhodopirellula sp.]|nr:imidazole glycerol phosphate synthase subunit HisH [Rhodopirellula sp.]